MFPSPPVMKLTAHFRKPEASASRIALVLNSYEDVPNGGGFFENSSDLFKSALPRYRRHPTKHKPRGLGECTLECTLREIPAIRWAFR